MKSNLLGFILIAAAFPLLAAAGTAPDHLEILAGDPGLRLTMEAPVAVIGGEGRQPDLFCSSRGTLFCQSQLPLDPFHTKSRMVYPVRLASAVSRDGGRTWRPFVHAPNHDEVNIEGGMAELADGTILLLDTYVVPGIKPDHGTGELWKSHDDLRTIEGPYDADFYLPKVAFTGSSDDRGRSHAAARLHRSIIVLPGGDLLSTLYCRFAGDDAPAGYIASMLKSRTVVVRSRDGGMSWSYLATVGMDSGVGTEGFGEPVLERIARGPHTGRLLCVMRTGRDLYQSHSDDEGATWSLPEAMRFPGIDIHHFEKWDGHFYNHNAPDYVPNDAMIGALVDPDLVQMGNGTLVCAIGMRAPAKRFFDNWHAPENGNYLAFSRDGGETWTEVVRFRSGAPTTQYIGIREVSPDVLYVVYDTSIWSSLGHKILAPGPTLGFRLAVEAAPMARRPALRRAVAALVDSGKFVGAVALVASRDRVLGVETAGYADLAAGHRVRADDLFWIASMSKPIAATAMMMLVDEGKVRLDDPVEKYLPEFKDLWVKGQEGKDESVLHRPVHPITVRNLLSHTSGLVPRSPFELPHIDALPLRDNVRVYPLVPLAFQPGSRYQYSNAGINTAGRIVEVVSGLPYEEFLQKRIFTPLGMNETTFWPTPAQLTRLAKSYRKASDGGPWRELPIDQLSYPLDDPRRGVCPAGGLFSTAEDVSLFGRMILDGGVYGGRRYLSRAAVAEMTSVQTGELPLSPPADAGYGFGWLIPRQIPGHAAPAGLGEFGHGGAYSTQLTIDPAHGLVTVRMVQRAETPPAVRDAAADELRRGVLAEFGN